MRSFFFIIAFLFSIFNFQFSIAQSIVFWNVENLYDTIPSPFYDDREFTPPRWDTERYNAKIANLARVLDELGADVAGLSEVENENVVRDLVMALDTPYNYIHRTSGDSRGIDLALLYKGDKFFPETTRLIESGTGREFLHVTGEFDGERIQLIVCHLASNLNPARYRERNLEALRRTLEGLLTEDPAARVVVMGDMNASPTDKLVRRSLGPTASAFDFVYNPFHTANRSGQGSYNFRDRWYLYDWMLVSPALARGTQIEAGIYAKEYLSAATRAGKRPKRTFFAGDYEGGFSDHFPVYIVIKK